MAVAAPIMSGEVKGALETQKNLGRITGDMDKAIERAVGLAANVVVARAQDNLSGPILKVRSGHLRGSLPAGVDLNKDGMDSSALVGTPVGYGAVHEFGSARNKAVKWLAKSLDQTKQKIRQIFDSAIKGVK